MELKKMKKEWGDRKELDDQMRGVELQYSLIFLCQIWLFSLIF